MGGGGAGEGGGFSLRLVQRCGGLFVVVCDLFVIGDVVVFCLGDYVLDVAV